MKVLALTIHGFRGISSADLVFDDHCVLTGPNGVGKSTVIDALSLVFGRSRLVPTLTEHDFRGSVPDRATRITIVATLGGFTPDDPDAHRGQWFRAGRGVEKYWDSSTRKAVPERAGSEPLCVQIGFCARFDHDELTVEQVRYFHDDDTSTDPFDEGVSLFPNALLNDIGFYVLPARRTWEMTLSFASELFRRAVAATGGVPSSAVIAIRDNIRTPSTPIEADPAIAPLVQAINTRLAQLLPSSPELQIRLTATDSESVLKALVPHYANPTSVSLPAGRHGGGLLALQTLILLLETGRVRRAANKSFILALEEPELHVPPSLQRQIVSEAKSVADQTICTTHSPRVGACYNADRVHVMRRGKDGRAETKPLLTGPALNIANAARRLLIDERLRLLEALMFPLVLVPEGRIDYEFLRLLAEIAQGSGSGASKFDTSTGLIPTPDGSVVASVARLISVRDGVGAIVDGDEAGNGYVTALSKLAAPPGVLIQLPVGWTIEDLVGWVVDADAKTVAHISARIGDASMKTRADLVSRLKSKERPDGLKEHYLAYEELAFALRDSMPCAARASDLLNGISDALRGEPSARLSEDSGRSTNTTRVLRIATV